jgi:hypothetical protein
MYGKKKSSKKDMNDYSMQKAAYGMKVPKYPKGGKISYLKKSSKKAAMGGECCSEDLMREQPR